jgi:hypothetical protein
VKFVVWQGGLGYVWSPSNTTHIFSKKEGKFLLDYSLHQDLLVTMKEHISNSTGTHSPIHNTNLSNLSRSIIRVIT